MQKRQELFFLLVILVCSACTAQKKNRNSENILFSKQVLDTQYISEGAAIADVNKDGKTDVLSGSFWWEAPHWKRHEITTPYIHPSIEGYGNSFLNFTMDVNQDGWDDMIKVGFPGKETFWYENPKNQGGHWQEHLVYASVGNESPAFIDIDGDGKKDLLCNDPQNKKVIWVSPPRTKGDTSWTSYDISNDSLTGTHMYTHGLGLGDINGDGRKDVIIREGWWEAPEDRTQNGWKFHRANLGDDCAQMFTLDLDGDQDADVISSSAHDYGIWWYEQQKQGDSSAWVKHEIFKEFSQSHGMALEDINNDGHPDLITGKRFWAHNGHDRGEREPAVIYWFEYKPGKQPVWVPHRIDDNSGIGLHAVVQDINGDGTKDVITANKKGVFVFKQTKN